MLKVTNETYTNGENRKTALQLQSEIADCFVQSGLDPVGKISFAACLLCKASQYNFPFGLSLDEIVGDSGDMREDERVLANKYISDIAWGRLLRLTAKYSPEQFALAAVLPSIDSDTRGAIDTPNSILDLAHKLLKVESGERVADVCCGNGSYLVSAALQEKGASYYGYEINNEACAVTSLRAKLVDADICVEACDAFTLGENKKELRFDKIFANYPFGVRQRNLESDSNYLERLAKHYPGMSKATSSDWVFNALLCDLLSDEGKAIGIMTNGSTSNSTDTLVRQFFVERKMVECVISLPQKMFASTNIPTTLIVLSHDNDGVRMIDATKLCQQGRRQNEFSEEDIATIVDALNVDTAYSKKVSIEDLRNNEYNLSFSRYAESASSFENGVPFETVVKTFGRGAPCTASQLDEMVSETPTEMQYLAISYIQDGLIKSNLPYLSYIDPKYEKYCLKKNSLIISKIGFPYKVAIATVKDGQKILANGNLYVIELDESKVNPGYVKAFFDSEQGQAVLKSITAGATVPNIGVDKLKKVVIPLPPMPEQDRIAQKHQAVLDEIADIKAQLDTALDKLKNIFK